MTILGQRERLTEYRDATDQIRRRLRVDEVMRHLGWRLSRGRAPKRADCGLCGGKEDVALKDEVWHCHHCKAGGSVFDLVMAVKDCDFQKCAEIFGRPGAS